MYRTVYMGGGDDDTRHQSSGIICMIAVEKRLRFNWRHQE